MISDIDPKTYAWLTSLKLGKRINTISEFQNGFYFGLIFDKLNLTKGKQFKNSHDMACIFQNYKNTKDLLQQNFKVQFSVNNIIYRTEELLKTLRDCCINYQQQKKQATLKSVQDRILPQTMVSQKQQNQFSMRQKQIKGMSKTYLNQTTKLPKKIQQIQKKLEKYRQEKTKHQLFALEDRKRQIDDGRRIVQDHRNYQISKLRANHEQTKQNQAKVYDVWLKTQQIKKMRMSKDEQFNHFMDEKKNKLNSLLREQQQRRFQDGLSQFQLNCMRQGIQLQHDPSKQFKPKQDNFNSVVVMERIKDNIKDHQKQRKQRVKRQNKKRVDAAQAKQKSQELWKQINLVQDLQKKMNSHFNACEKINTLQMQKKAEAKTIQNKYKSKIFLPLKQIQASQIQKRDEQLRKNKIVYLTKEVQRLQRRYQKHTSLASDALQAILMTTIMAQEKGAQGQGFSYSEWKQLQNFFIAHKKQNKKTRHSTFTNQVSEDLSNYDGTTDDYIHQTGEWCNLDANQGERNLIPHHQLANIITSVVDNIYPIQVAVQKTSIPLYMPLRIGLNGTRLSGKSTQVQKLIAKYNINLIDPKAIIKQAIDLAKPPAVQDPKKKKQAKKPQEQTPQKIALKKFGQKLLGKLQQQEVQNLQKIHISHLISAIKFKIEQLFTPKTNSQLILNFEQQRQKEEQRLKQQLKDLQEGNKKKKDSKKGAQTVTEVLPKFNPYFYTTGFIIDNLDLSVENLKLIQKQLNGYVSEEQKINPLGEQIKRQLSSILPIPQRQIDLSLKKGFFNILIDLNNLNKQNAESRNLGRKIDPQTQIVYHPKFNPIPTDIKGFAQKLVELPNVDIQSIYGVFQPKPQPKQFYSLFGNQRAKFKSYAQFDANSSQQQISQKLSELVQKVLDIQYEQVGLLKQKQKNLQETTKANNPQLKGKEEGLNQTPVLIQPNAGEDSKVSIDQNAGLQNEQQSIDGEQQRRQDFDAFKNQGSKSLQTSIGDIIRGIQISKLGQLLNKFQNLCNNYKIKVKINLHQFQVARKSFQTELAVEQRQFVSIINRPDDKAGKILSFQQNYNKLLLQKQSIIKDKQATKHLIQKLDQLYDSLWVSIQAKKNQAVTFRQNLLYSNWINKQTEKLTQISKEMLQNELNYTLQTLLFILLINLAYNQDGHEPVIDYLCLGIPEQAQPVSTIDLPQISSSPRMHFYLSQTQRCLQQIFEWFKKKQIRSKTRMNSSLQALAKAFIEDQTINLKKIMANLKERVMERIRQQVCYYKCLVNKMDDWIIVGIKTQNDFVYQIYKTIKQSIIQIKKSSIKDLFPKQITLALKPIQRITQEHIPIPSQQFSIQLFSYKIFLEQIKCLSYYKNQNLKINFVRFKEYFQKRKKSKLLHQEYLKLDYDKTQQYLVSDGQCNFKQIALATLFWNKVIFDIDSIKKYKRQLNNDSSNSSLDNSQAQFKNQTTLQKIQQTQRQNEQTDLLKNESELIHDNPVDENNQNLRQNVSFDQFFLPDCLNLNQKEARIVKRMVFDILKQQFTQKINVDQWIDTLKMFNLLQIFKFGDAVMMLNENKR